jgi:putative FmdB family regulatory protein
MKPRPHYCEKVRTTVPIYEYECKKCGRVAERLQGIHDPDMKKCPSCSGKMEKKMSAGAFVLKGTGFYANDYPHGSNGGGNGKGKKKEADPPASCPAFADATGGKPAAEGGKVPPACAGCPKAEK